MQDEFDRRSSDEPVKFKWYHDVLCLIITTCFIMLICLGIVNYDYPLRLKLSRSFIGSSFHRSEAIGERLLNSPEYNTPEARFNDITFSGNFRSLSDQEIEICESIIFEECSVLKVPNFPVFAASVYLHKDSSFRTKMPSLIERSETGNVWTTLDNQTSLEEAADIIRQGITLRESDRKEKNSRLMKCRQERIINDCE